VNERIYRTVDDRVVAGVCGGFAVRLGIDPSLVRVAYAVVTLLTGIFPALILYVIMAVVIPEEPTGFAGRAPSPAPPGPGAVPGWVPPGAGAAGSVDPAGTGETGWPPAATSAEDAGWPAPEAGGPAPAPATSASWATTPTGAPGPSAPPGSERPGSRGVDGRMAGLIGGLVLVGLGLWFLVRDRLDIDWGIVWAAGLMAVGVVIVIAAFRPRR
jgi:phage shock protein C